MSDLVERLREVAERADANYPAIMEQAAAEIERLRAENTSLASWQCEFTDGKTGLVYGEGGSTYCAMAKEVERLRAALDEQVQWVKDLADSLMEAEGKIGVKNARIEQLEAEAKRRTLDYLGQVGQLSDELERLRAALRGAEAWLQNWAVHAGRCEGGNGCTCGLTAIRFDTRAALGEERT